MATTQKPTKTAPAPEPKKPKSRLRFGVAALVVGVLIGTGLLVLGLTSMPDIGTFPRSAGEQQAVTLDAGNWTVFAEGLGLAPVEITGPDEQLIEIQTSGSRFEYRYGGRRGHSIGTVDIPTTGQYLIVNQPGGTTAFAQHFGSDLAEAIGLMVAGGVFGLGIAILGLVLIVVELNRRAARNAASR